MSKRWIGGGAVIAIIAVLIWIYMYHQPRNMKLDFSSTIYSPLTKFEKQTTITLDGDHYKRLLGGHVFRGVMIADDLSYTVELKESRGTYFGWLTSSIIDPGMINSIGSVMMSGQLESIWIQLDDVNERYNLTEGYVAGPAKTMEEANAIARKILEGR